MWILKGSLLGVLIFSILFATRFYRVFYHALIDPKLVSLITVRSVFFWMGLVGSLLVGCAIIGFWTINPKL